MRVPNFLASALLVAFVAVGCSKDQTKPEAKTSAADDKTAAPSQEAPAKSPHAPAADTKAGPHAQPAASLGEPRHVVPSGDTRQEVLDGLKLTVPSEWELRPGRSKMRKGEFVLPGPGGGAQLIVYRFPGGAGGAAANIERWRGQVITIPGEEADTSKLEADGLTISSVDISGRYVGQSMPGAPPQPAIEDARMFAAAIEGEGDPYYLKLVGPKPTVDLWASAWTQLLEGLAPASAGPKAEGAAEGQAEAEQPSE